MGTKLQIAEEVLRLCDQQMADIGRQLAEIAAVEQVRELAGQFKAAQSLLRRGIELVSQGGDEPIVLGERTSQGTAKTLILSGSHGEDSAVAMRLSKNEVQAFLKIGQTISDAGAAGIDLKQATEVLGVSFSGGHRKVALFVEQKLLSKAKVSQVPGAEGPRNKYHLTELGTTLLTRLRPATGGTGSNGVGDRVH